MRAALLGFVQITGLAVCLVVPHPSAQAAFITGPGDPDYTTLFQGASAQTFATQFGFTVGTGPNDLKVSTGIWIDPSGLIFAQVYTANANIANTGTTTNKLSFGYVQPSVVANPGNARDYSWIQNTANNTTLGNTSLDRPWLGNVFDMGGQANKAVVFPVIDHGPLPGEAVEYTVYVGNDPTSTNLADWHLARLQEVYMQGWEIDTISLADGFTTVWGLANPADTFRFVSVSAVGSQSLADVGCCGNDDEIDAVAGLTAQGTGVGSVPEPGTLALLLATTLAGLRTSRRRLR